MFQILKKFTQLAWPELTLTKNGLDVVGLHGKRAREADCMVDVKHNGMAVDVLGRFFDNLRSIEGNHSYESFSENLM